MKYFIEHIKTDYFNGEFVSKESFDNAINEYEAEANKMKADLDKYGVATVDGSDGELTLFFSGEDITFELAKVLRHYYPSTNGDEYIVAFTLASMYDIKDKRGITNEE